VSDHPNQTPTERLAASDEDLLAALLEVPINYRDTTNDS
jgi:hypothetical protein